MEALLIYLLKSTALLTILVALFVALMQQETFHRLNRFTLLAIIALSLMMPMVNIGIETPLTRFFAEQEKAYAATAAIDLETIQATAIYQETPAVQEKSIDWESIIFAIYITGVILLLARSIFMYASLARIIKRGTPTAASKYTNARIHLRVREEESIKPFSWFRWVVINRQDLNESGREIITHEATHATRLHSLDIIFIDLVILLQWFNPMAWFTKYCIKNIHEFEADEAVINSGTDIGRYQQLIIKKAVGARLYSIANSFNHSSTIKRITMMCKKKSNRWRGAKALYLLPAAAIAALLFSQPESVNATLPASDSKVTEFIENSKESTTFVAENSPATPPAPDKREVLAVGEVKHTQPSDTAFVYMVVEEMPQFPGGANGLMTFLRNSIIYPQEACDAGTQGKCFVTFVIDSSGKVKDARVEKSSGDAALDKESVRAVESMPRWTPGKQSGKAVAVQYTLPIAFRLQSTPQPKTKQDSLNALLKKANELEIAATKLRTSGNTSVSDSLLTKADAVRVKFIELHKEEAKANSPLLIINGAIYEGSANIINNIKEEDVKSINVMKEDAATKLYGEKGKNGAIIIEVKKSNSPFLMPGTTATAHAKEQEPKQYQFNVGFKQEEIKDVAYTRPAEFKGETRDLQLGSTKAVIESGLTEGSVTIEFNVETDGTITFVKVKKSSGNNRIDTEAMTMLYNTTGKWTPALQDGKPVRTRPSLTLTFSKKG